MNCLECQDVLQQRLDGDPIADRAALDLHLAACAECRARHAAAQRLEEGLRGTPRPTPPADLTDRTVARVLDDRLRRLRLRRRVGFLLAASLLLAAVGAYFSLQSGPAQTVVVQVVVKAPETPADSGVSLR